MTDCTQRLAEAQQALHQLQLGRQVVKVEVHGAPGRSVTYTPGNIEQLKRYIAGLEAQCSAQTQGRPSRGCLTFTG